MNPNPYEPLTASSEPPSNRYSAVLAGISILAAIFSLLPLSYSILALSVNYNASVQKGGPIPAYIAIMAGLIACCIAALVYSWLRWHSGRFFASCVSFAVAVSWLTVGPWVIVMLGVKFSR